jgi:hypothetical protein
LKTFLPTLNSLFEEQFFITKCYITNSTEKISFWGNSDNHSQRSNNFSEKLFFSNSNLNEIHLKKLIMFSFLSTNFFTSPSFVWLDAAEPWQFGFQSAATPLMGGITNFHDHIMFFPIGVGVFVFLLLFRCLSFYSADTSANKINNFTHSTNPENIWTVVSAILLFFVFQKKLFLNIYLFIFPMVSTSETLDFGVFIFNTVEINLIFNLLPFFLFVLFLEKKSQIYIFTNKMCVCNPKTLNFLIYLIFSLIFSSNHQNVECMMYSHPHTHASVSEGFMLILRRLLCIPDEQFETVEVHNASRYPLDAITDPGYFVPDPSATTEGNPNAHIVNHPNVTNLPQITFPPAPTTPEVLSSLSSQATAPLLSSSEARDGLPRSAFRPGAWPFSSISRFVSSSAEDVSPSVSSSAGDMSPSISQDSLVSSWDEGIQRKKILETLNRLLQVDPARIDYGSIETNFRILYDLQPYREDFINPESFIVFSDPSGQLRILKGSQITEENVGLIYASYINQQYLSVTNIVTTGLLSPLTLIETEPTSVGGTRVLPMLKIQLPFTPFQEKVFWNISIILLCASGVLGISVLLPGVAAATQASSVASTLFGTGAIMYIERGLNHESSVEAFRILEMAQTFTK